MKKGDIIRCTNNYVTDRCITVHALTVGKDYEILATDGEYIEIENDQGITCAFYSSRFELVNRENEEVSNMRNEFEVGGKAICVDADGVTSLTEDKVYDILDIDGDVLIIEGDLGKRGGFYSSRFYPVNKENEGEINMNNEFEVGGRVECMEAMGINGITEGKVYEVLEVLEDILVIKDDCDMPAYYCKDRFNPLIEIKPIEVKGATTITANGLTISDNECKAVSGITNTGEPSKVENGEIKPMLSMTKEDVDNAVDIIDASTQIIQLPVDIDILGTVYTIEVVSVEDDSYLDGIYGYCDFLTKSIVIRELKPLDYQGNIDAINVQYRTNLRHELMHAFLYESGLDSSTSDNWARNEEMIDFMALQLPKIFRVFNECGITE